MDFALNLPAFDINTRTYKGQQQVFDPIRKKFVALTPEEWVRQHIINYLVEHKSFPAGLIAVEHPVVLSGMQQRVDIVVFSRSGDPVLVVECKADSVKITQDTFAQAARYNLVLKASYLVVSNGLKHYCSRVDLENKKFTPLPNIPMYDDLA